MFGFFGSTPRPTNWWTMDVRADSGDDTLRYSVTMPAVNLGDASEDRVVTVITTGFKSGTAAANISSCTLGGIDPFSTTALESGTPTTYALHFRVTAGTTADLVLNYATSGVRSVHAWVFSCRGATDFRNISKTSLSTNPSSWTVWAPPSSLVYAYVRWSDDDDTNTLEWGGVDYGWHVVGTYSYTAGRQRSSVAIIGDFSGTGSQTVTTLLDEALWRYHMAVAVT